MSNELEYGPVVIIGGAHKGRIFYYDDDDSEKTAICYVGHPLNFCGTYAIRNRLLREPTIDDLIKRREELWKILSQLAIAGTWDIEPRRLHELWSEKSLVDDTLYERRLFGEFGHLEQGKEVFLCHKFREQRQSQDGSR